MPEFMSSKEVAAYFRVHMSTISRLTRQGDIPFILVGHVYRYRKEDLDAWAIKLGQDARTSRQRRPKP